MAKNVLGDWSETAADNTDVGGINIAEGCAAANINNALREIMAQLAVVRAVSDGGTGASTEAGARTSLGVEIGVDVQGYSAALASITTPAAVANWNSAITSGLVYDDGDGANAPAAETLVGLIASEGTRIWQATISEDGSTLYTRRSNNSGSTWTTWAATPTARASQAEAEAGTSNTVLMTPLRTAQAIDAQPNGIGFGQTFAIQTRSLGVTYTNGTSKPIQLLISVSCAATEAAQLLIGGSVMAQVSSDGGTTAATIPISAIVPPGVTYRLNASAGTPTINRWAELR